MSESDTSGLRGMRDGPVVVGVHPQQASAVVIEAARLANAFSRPLVCAWVTDDSYLAEWDHAALRDAESLHPDDLTPDDERIGLDLAASVTAALGADQPEAGWSLRILGGDPAKALVRIADELDARVLVVGTHQRGIAHALDEWLAGSVATKLAHHQDRTVVVVPVTRGEGAKSSRLA